MRRGSATTASCRTQEKVAHLLHGAVSNGEVRILIDRAGGLGLDDRTGRLEHLLGFDPAAPGLAVGGQCCPVDASDQAERIQLRRNAVPFRLGLVVEVDRALRRLDGRLGFVLVQRPFAGVPL
jgi:hypothetical protein